jgi:hypothetical protein
MFESWLDESVRTSWPSSRPTFEDASVGPEVYSFARIKARAPSGLKAPARRLAQGGRLRRRRRREGDDGGAAQRARQVCSESQGEVAQGDIRRTQPLLMAAGSNKAAGKLPVAMISSFLDDGGVE